MGSAVGFGLRLMRDEWFVKYFVWCHSVPTHTVTLSQHFGGYVMKRGEELRPMLASFPLASTWVFLKKIYKITVGFSLCPSSIFVSLLKADMILPHQTRIVH